MSGSFTAQKEKKNTRIDINVLNRFNLVIFKLEAEFFTVTASKFR